MRILYAFIFSLLAAIYRKIPSAPAKNAKGHSVSTAATATPMAQLVLEAPYGRCIRHFTANVFIDTTSATVPDHLQMVESRHPSRDCLTPRGFPSASTCGDNRIGLNKRFVARRKRNSLTRQLMTSMCANDSGLHKDKCLG